MIHLNSFKFKKIMEEKKASGEWVEKTKWKAMERKEAATAKNAKFEEMKAKKIAAGTWVEADEKGVGYSKGLSTIGFRISVSLGLII